MNENEILRMVRALEEIREGQKLQFERSNLGREPAGHSCLALLRFNRA
jgi:hypothetical protein